MGQSTWGFVAQRSSPGYIHPAITEKKTEIDSPSKTTFNMKCLMVLLLSVMTVVMGSSEPIYSDGYPCLCYDNLLGGDTYQVRRWPWPATYVAEPKFPLQLDGQQQRQFFSLPPGFDGPWESRRSRYNVNFSLDLLAHPDPKDSMDLGEILVFPDLLERLVRKELRREFVKYLR